MDTADIKALARQRYGSIAAANAACCGAPAPSRRAPAVSGGAARARAPRRGIEHRAVSAFFQARKPSA